MAEQLWVTNTLGGYMGCPKLSKQLRHAAQPMMRFRQFTRIKEEFNKNENDTIFFDKISKISTAGGTLVETETMPRRNYKVVQGTAVITEYGNAIPFSGKLEALAEFNVDDATTKVLRNDEASSLDTAVATQFAATLAKYVCSGTATGVLSTNGTASGTAGSATGHGNLNDLHVKDIVDQLKKWDVQPYDNNGNYICVGSVNALRGIRDDTNFINAARYGDPERLFTGEIGKYYGCRFIEETNYLSNVLGGSYGEAAFFGDDAVLEAVTIPEEIRYDIPKDFGRSKAVAWYALLGFQIVWCGTGTGEGGVDTTKGFVPHIIHVTSL